VTWPLIGRSEEFDVLVGAMRDEAGNGVVIAGPAGVGKTRLARETAAVLAIEFAVEWTAATPSSVSIPFGALAHLVPDVDAASHPPDDRFWMLRRISASLLARAAGKPLVVAVDDAQWLDPSAATLVHHLVTTRAARVLLTMRTGEPAPDAISALWKDALVERLELQPLTRLDVEALVESALDGPVDRPTLERFTELSGGNPLYLRELVLGVVETGAFSSVDGVWRWTGDFQSSLRLSTILDDRLTRVSASGRTVLDHLAVGEPLPLDTLVSLCGADGAGGVAEVERARLAVVGEGHGLPVRLSHPLYAEQLRAEISVVERRALTARLAQAFEHGARHSRGDLLRVASWQLESGGRADAELLTEAAEIARAGFDLALAERLARRAVEAGGGLRASLSLGWVLIGQGRTPEALAVLDPFADGAYSGREHADIASARYAALTGAHGFRPEFASVLREAEERVDDPQTRSYLRAQRVSLLTVAGKLDEAVALASTLDDDLDDASAFRLATVLGAALATRGKWDAAVAVSDRVIESALRHRDDIPLAPFWVVSARLTFLSVSGRLDDADALIERIDATVCSGAARGDVATLLAAASGMVALRRGQVRTAARWLREAAGGMREVSDFRLPTVLAPLAEASALAGDSEGAIVASGEADALVDHAAIFEGVVRGARAWAALAHGQRTAAAELALAAAAWGAAHDQGATELLSLHDALRLGADRRVAQQIVALAPEIEGPLARGITARAAGVLADDGVALDAAATQFDEIGARLLAAEAAADASAAFRRAGMLARAERSATRARVLLSACEGARSPGIDEFETPLPLTPREREVALLAADGLSAKAIGERLFVSTRTIEGHLHRTYTKLGVTDRTGLARLLAMTSES
jgi:DNA-binding NarL/FixJ family response regulator